MNCDKKQRAYISYMKASCGEYAKEISKALFGYGYGVFYDRKSQRSGEFDKNLYLAINNSEWFIIILDKHIFEGWNGGKNWIHKEVSHALEEKKKIICIKTPGLDVDAEIPAELCGKLFTDSSEIIELDKKNPDKTALKVREVFERNMGRFEKSINRVFSEIYLWRILLFSLLGAAIMGMHISHFYNAYIASSSMDGYTFKQFGVATTVFFNLFYAVLGTLLCGIFMYVTRKIIKMDIIPLFLSDVGGIVIISMMARKITDVIFSLGSKQFWTSSMGLAVWNVPEVTAVYMVFITAAIQLLLYLFKRSRSYV